MLAGTGESIDHDTLAAQIAPSADADADLATWAEATARVPVQRIVSFYGRRARLGERR